MKDRAKGYLSEQIRLSLRESDLCRKTDFGKSQALRLAANALGEALNELCNEK